MTSLETELQNCQNLLLSDRITERKKGVVELNDLLDRDAIIQKLNKISKTEADSSSWNSLFTASHNALIREVNKYIGKADPKNFASRENNKRLFITTVTKIVKRGTEGTLIKCGSIIDAVIHVLESPHYRNEIGSSYLNILYDNVLSVPKYLGSIKLEDWEKLLELCIEIFENRENPIPQSKTSIIIAIMYLVVKHGSEHSSLLSVIKKKIFVFLKNIIQVTLSESAEFQFQSLKLVLITCEKLKKECRIMICRFTEEICDRLLDIRTGREFIHDDKKITKQSLLFDVLLLAVQCHHPNGASQKSEIDEAYAYNWDDWNRKLSQLSLVIYGELNNRQKYKKLEALPDNFVQLAVEVYNQIICSGTNFIDVTFNETLNETFSNGERNYGMKRRRIMHGFAEFIDRLKQCEPVDMWPWLSVISSLVSQYPKILNDCDYILLLQTMSKLLSTSKEQTVTNYLCSCCIALIDVRRAGHLAITSQDEDTLWDSIWNTVLRTIGLNQSAEWSHKLLRHMMNFKWNVTMRNSVLKLFISQVVRLSPPSLMTLRQLRLRLPFPPTYLDFSIHSTLLRWLLPVNSEYSSAGYYLTDLPLEYYAQMVVLVCLQNNVKDVPRSVAPLEFEFNFCSNLSAAEIHKLSSYNCDIFRAESNEKPTVIQNMKKEGCVLNKEALEALIHLLEDHKQSLFDLDICKTSIVELANVNDAITAVQYLNSFVLFLIRIHQFLEFYTVTANTTRLDTILDEVLKNSITINRRLFPSELNPSQRINLSTVTTNFFQHLGSLPSHLIKKTLENFFPLLEPPVEWMENELVEENMECTIIDEKNESLFETKNLPMYDRLKLEACKLLVGYSFNRNSACAMQYQVLEKVLEILIEFFSRTKECSRGFLVMSTFTVQAVFSLKTLHYEDESVQVNLFPDAIKVIRGICSATDNSWYTINESALALLKLIQQAIIASRRQKDTSEWEELVQLIRAMKTAISDCGPQITLEMARCLSLFKIENGDDLQNIDDSATNILMSAHCDLLRYLRSPYHEVRVALVNWLPSIFAFADLVALRNNTLSFSNEIVDNFSSSLLEVFVIEGLTEDELVDENLNRPLTAFYALASAICNSRTSRRRHLFMLFYVVHDKRLNPELAFKILKLVGQHLKKDVDVLIKDNLSFVLFSWYTKYKSYENFPFQALGRSSIKEFYSTYMKEVVVILLHLTDLKKIDTISNTLEITSSDIVKECFPEIMGVLLKKSAEGPKSNANAKMAVEVRNFVFNTLTNEVVEQMTIKNLADILTCILRHLHDADFEISKPSVLPLPTSLTSDSGLLQETIKCLQVLMGANVDVILYVAENYPKLIQKIFQKLFVDIRKASTPEIKLECLQKYFMFCTLLMPHHTTLSDHRLDAFISRTIIENLMCVLLIDGPEADLAFSKSTLKFFLKFISAWLSDDERYIATANVFSSCLKGIVDKLVIVMSRDEELVEDSLKILRYLLRERSNVLSAGIINLEQFPDRAEFSEFRNAHMEMLETQTEGSDIRHDIKLFLNTSENSLYSPCRLESLKYLREKLTEYKFELIDLFKNCVAREFSEESDKNLAHRLLCTLIQQTKFKDDNVKSEAVRCLTEIGLVNLHTLGLKHNIESTLKADCKPELFLAENVCAILKDCIVDENVDLVNAACKVLYGTLYSLEGFEVVTNRMNSLQKSFIRPFIPQNPENVNKKSVWLYFSIEKFNELVNVESLWSPDDPSYTAWIQNLVEALCNSFNVKCFLNAIQTVCKLKVSVAETIFKCVMNLLAACDIRRPAEILGHRTNQFLKQYFNSNASENLPDSLSSSVSCGKDTNISIYNEKSCIQILLDAANFIRLSRAVDTNDLNLNYLYVAKAALHCHAYFTCILYAELYLNSLIKEHDGVHYDGNILSYLEAVEKETFENQNDLLNVLREAFSRIGDSDALYGCGSSSLLDSDARILHYQQIGKWSRVIESCDISLACNPLPTSRVNDLTSALGNSCFNHLQSITSASLDQLNPHQKNAQYQCAWKLGQWDIEEPCDDEKTFYYYQFAALRDIHRRNYEGARVHVEQAKSSLVNEIARVGLESTKNVYYVMGKLQCLQDIENFTLLDDISDVIKDWYTRDGLSAGLNFDHKQIISYQRVRMINMDLEEARDFVLSIAKQARRDRDFNFADICLSLIKYKQGQSVLNDLRVRFEEARVLWDRDENDVARYLIKDLLKRDETTESHTFCAVLNRTYGKWLSEINFENADTIIQEHFQKAADLLPETPGETGKERKIRLKTYKQLAEFADRQYKEIAEYIKSDVFVEQKRYVSESRKKASAMDVVDGGSDKVWQKTKITLANQSKMEHSEVKDMQSKEERYMMLAFKYYLKGLIEGDEEDLKVFRVISFWLNQKTNVNLHKELLSAMSAPIPSYKFLPVLPQLMAHVTRNTAECFGNLLTRLLVTCARDHPHHTLPLIFSLVNYTADDKYSKSASNSNKNEDRVIAARDLIRQLRSDKKIKNIIGQMEEMNEAYIELAYDETTTKRVPGAATKISQNLRILKIKDFENTFCPTFQIPINKSGRYEDIVGIRRIENKVTYLGGVNAPKKISCLCTDGQVRDQMVKGQDDMRMDAVMQQVFTIMNKLLSANKHTSKRNLLLRTYKIVPLSQRSGVLEFCTNTMSLSEYLKYISDTSKGAHKRFRPNDMTTREAWKMLMDYKRQPDKKRIEVFKKVCSQIKPVFRYFFVEHFPSTSVWFERKLAYIHSVATTSMVGYILGLGDRHVQNILIDKKTAELIHIDFGIAFDQGLNLTYPERIPFRLTRDIEDGMGIISIDGIFRRCCEQVMTVLRENTEIICTTSEVFIHDPLYSWTLTPEKCASVQNEKGKNAEVRKDVEINITASRALSRLKLKLQGVEDGTPTSVAGQVNRLIQQAKNINNLALLFEGWQAFL